MPCAACWAVFGRAGACDANRTELPLARAAIVHAACHLRSPPKAMRSTGPVSSVRSRPCVNALGLSSSAKWAMPAGNSCSGGHGRSCFRSTGRSPSARDERGHRLRHSGCCLARRSKRGRSSRRTPSPARSCMRCAMLNSRVSAKHRFGAIPAGSRTVRGELRGEELDIWALALDGAKRPCRIRNSIGGELLFTGMVGSGRALQVVRQLTCSTFFSSCGIRTVPRGKARYRPMSDHNGSIRLHDKALNAAGRCCMVLKRRSYGCSMPWAKPQ